MLEIKHLSKTYKEKQLMAIDDVSFSIRPSEIVMIVGPSGCGKTTILNIISGNLINYEGTVEGTFKKIGYVFQEDRLLEWKTVYENVSLVTPKENESRVMRILEEVGLKGFESYYPRDLSGGMRQRCSIARALCYGSDILLLDEPFKSLDYKLRQEMLQLINKIRRMEDTAVLFVTHNIDEALKLADRVLILTKGPSKIAKELKISLNSEARDLKASEFQNLKNTIITQLEN